MAQLGEIIDAEDGSGFTVLWPHGGTHLEVGPCPTIEEAQMISDALAVKEALALGLPLSHLNLYCDQVDASREGLERPPALDVSLDELTAQLPAVARWLAESAADAACDLLTPAELGSPRVVRTLLNYGSTLAVAANVRGDPWRCCALVVHEPPLAAVIDGMLRSDGALRALVARMPLAGLLDARSPHQFLVELLRLAPQACLARVQRERWTPLHLAAAGGNVRATAVLLEAVPEAAYAEDLDGRLPMHCACAQGHVGIVRLLLRAAPETAAMLAHDSEEDAMDAAIVCGHPEVVKALLAHDAALLGDGVKRLCVAIVHNRPEVIAALIEYEPKLAEQRAPSGAPLVLVAVMAGQAEALRALLSAAPHVAAATLQEGTTALHYAAECGKTDCIDVLLAAAPQLARTAAGDSEVLPIHLAAMHGQPEAARRLLLAAPDTADVTSKGHNALHLACSFNQDQVLEVLLDLEPQLANTASSDEQYTGLHLAAMDGSLACVQQLCQAAPQLATQGDAWGATPLVLASAAGCAEAVQLLLETAPQTAEQTDNEGFTPLHAAAANSPGGPVAETAGHVDAVHQLLRAAPNTADARTNKGLNALHLACSTFRPRVLEALLDLAPQLASSVTTEEQQTAMHVAALDGGGACLELLCHVAPQLATQVDAWGATPLVLASGAGSADMAALLLDAAPIAVDMGDNMGYLPIHAAAEAGHADVLRVLVAAAPDTATERTDDHYTPLDLAARFGHLPCIEVLLSAVRRHLALLGGEGDYGVPLHSAAASNQVAAMRLLLAAAPEAATAVNPDGQTPLQYVLSLPGALQPGGSEEQPECTDAVRCLLSAGPGPAVVAALAAAGTAAQPFIADFVLQRQPLSAEEWAAVPAPCPGLRHALPAVLERSAQQAQQLVRHLPAHDAARLRCGALCLGRAQRSSGAHLPLPLVWRVLGLSLTD